MTAVRLSRLAVEALVQADPNVRLSRLAVEALVRDANPPDAPTTPSATALSSSSIQVDWTPATGDPTGHRVERSADGSTGWADVSGNLAADAATYTDTGLDASTTYYYRIVAFNDDGDSVPSSTVNATTDAGPTPPPPGADRVLPSPTTHRIVRNGR